VVLRDLLKEERLAKVVEGRILKAWLNGRAQILHGE
jgi:hypothetical protein